MIRAAGDIASIENEELISRKHVEEAIKRNRTVEEQIKDRYGSYTKGLGTDITSAQKERSPYYFWNEHTGDDKMFH